MLKLLVAILGVLLGLVTCGALALVPVTFERSPERDAPPAVEIGPPTVEVNPPPIESEFSLAVSYTVTADQLPSDLPAPPAGEEWLAVVASLINNGQRVVAVGPEDLRLVDAAGTSYLPAADIELGQAVLIGSEVGPGSVYGSVVFALPAGAVPAELVWCPAAACDQAVRSQIP